MTWREKVDFSFAILRTFSLAILRTFHPAFDSGSNHWTILGVNAVYQPTPTGFRVYVRNSDGSALTPAAANGWGWSLTWRAVNRQYAIVTQAYSFNGQRIAQRKDGVLTYLHADHLGSTLLATDAQGNVAGGNQPRYFAYGRERTPSLAALPTDYTYTGQKQDGSGLIYMNARYYDPQIGQFISPDSLVPDPSNIFNYNRYMYSLGNPIRLMDPSGHIAVCFQGSPDNATTAAENPKPGSVSVPAMCQQALAAAGYNEKEHGQILYLNNGVDAIDYAYEQVVAAKTGKPTEPVIIIGYSWGGAAALDLSNRLSGKTFIRELGNLPSGRKSIPVDLLFLVDPEPDMRGIAPKIGPLFGVNHANSSPVPEFVSDNVKTAINLYAVKANRGTLATQEWMWQNGMNHVAGALNVGLSDVVIAGTTVPIDHLNFPLKNRGRIKTLEQIDVQTLLG